MLNADIAANTSWANFSSAIGDIVEDAISIVGIKTIAFLTLIFAAVAFLIWPLYIRYLQSPKW